MDTPSLGKVIVLVGLLVAFVGGLVWLSARLGLPFGRLPGDIYVKGEHSTFYFPIVTSLLLSVVLSLILTLIYRFFRK